MTKNTLNILMLSAATMFATIASEPEVVERNSALPRVAEVQQPGQRGARGGKVIGRPVVQARINQLQGGQADATREEVQADAPREGSQADAPREEVQPDATREEVQADAPREGSQADAPREEVQPDAPREGSQADAPREEVQPDAPREGSQADAPREEVQPDAPREGSQPDAPREGSQADAPREGGQADAPREEVQPDADRALEGLASVPDFLREGRRLTGEHNETPQAVLDAFRGVVRATLPGLSPANKKCAATFLSALTQAVALEAERRATQELEGQ
jgi:hypothetical protein